MKPISETCRVQKDDRAAAAAKHARTHARTDHSTSLVPFYNFYESRRSLDDLLISLVSTLSPQPI